VLSVSISVVDEPANIQIEQNKGKASCLLCSFGTQAGGEKTMLSVLEMQSASAIRLMPSNALIISGLEPQ
jgi:hypothetical protein